MAEDETRITTIPSVHKETTEAVPSYPSVLEELHLQQKFELTHESEGARYSDLIPLSSSIEGLNLCIIKAESPSRISEDYSLLLIQKTVGDTKPVGHVDFRRWHQTPKEAKAGMTVLDNPNFSNGLPDELSTAVDMFASAGGEPAMRIQEDFKGTKLGGVLWALGCAYMENEGVKAISISGDVTKGKKEGGKGFYQRYGAQTYTVEQPVLTLDPAERKTKPFEKEFTLARPTPEQQVLITRAFDL